MTQEELLRYLVEALEDLNIPYAVVGSIASIAYGEPRTTVDIDVVVDVAPEDVENLKTRFPDPPFHLDEESARRAIKARSQFNVIHPKSGFKIDLHPTDDRIARSQIRRSRKIEVGPDLRPRFSPPEEIIIKKMEYFREGGSDKHLRDIASMISVSGDHIDQRLVEEWAERLDLIEIWSAIVQGMDG